MNTDDFRLAIAFGAAAALAFHGFRSRLPVTRMPIDHRKLRLVFGWTALACFVSMLTVIVVMGIL